MTRFEVTEGDLALFIGTVIAVAVATLLLSSVLFRNSKKEKQPVLVPLAHADLLAAIQAGNFHRLLKALMAKFGPVFRVRWTAGSTFTVVGDPRVMRAILEDKGASDKTAENVSILRRITNGHPNILSRKTSDSAYVVSRKGLAGAFSFNNLYAALPALQHKLQEFVAILDDHVARGATLTDVPTWFTRLTVDLISSAMFSHDFHTLATSDHDPAMPSSRMYPGEVYLTRFPQVLLEFGVRNAGQVQ